LAVDRSRLFSVGPGARADRIDSKAVPRAPNRQVVVGAALTALLALSQGAEGSTRGHPVWIDVSEPGSPSEYVGHWPGLSERGALA
jgi:hypothetical protein